MCLELRLSSFIQRMVSAKVQELQMTTQTGDNTHVIAIDGNFDDAQTNVKHMFNDVALREKLAANKLQFSSANSMNIGRLVPQIVYYVYAYAQLVKSGEIVAGERSISQYQQETLEISWLPFMLNKLVCQLVN